MSGKTFSGAALMVAVRWMRNASGLVAAMTRTTTIARTTRPITTPTMANKMLSMGFPQKATPAVRPGVGHSVTVRTIPALTFGVRHKSLSAEVRRRVEDLAQLALAVAGERQELLGDLDRLLLRLHLQQREAGDQLLRFGEWAVGHAVLGPRAAQPRSSH